MLQKRDSTGKYTIKSYGMFHNFIFSQGKLCKQRMLILEQCPYEFHFIGAFPEQTRSQDTMFILRY